MGSDLIGILKMIDFRVVKSSSSGNAFSVNNRILIDVGVQFRYIDFKPEVVILTHTHSDHFCQTTLRKLIVEYDPIIFAPVHFTTTIGLNSRKIVKVEYPNVYKWNDYKFMPVIAHHDVPNYGYRVAKTQKHLHITDTSSVEGIEAKNYDSASVECNYCEIKMDELCSQKYDTYQHFFKSKNNHLSVQKCIKFMESNSIHTLYPCHISSLFENEVWRAFDENPGINVYR